MKLNISFKNWNKASYLLLISLLTMLSIFIASMIIMFKDLTVYEDNGNTYKISNFVLGKAILSYPYLVYPFLSFLLNIAAICLSFIGSVVNIIFLVRSIKKGKQPYFAFATFVIIIAVLIFLTQYANYQKDNFSFYDYNEVLTKEWYSNAIV